MFYATGISTDFGYLRLLSDAEMLLGAELGGLSLDREGQESLKAGEMQEAERMLLLRKKKRSFLENAEMEAVWIADGDAEDIAPLKTALSWYRAYFSGEQPDPYAVPLRLCGSPFQEEVWEIVRGIPYGQVLSYGEIAHVIAARRGIPRMAAQAVGGAVGKNHFSILIPCHRVLGADGAMVGYGCAPGSLEQKRALLLHEGVLWAPDAPE